jgi:ferric-dicitrate binding protein FerR (iron transport regulator)
MNHTRLNFLLKRYKRNQCTEAELAELNDWFHMHNPGTSNMQNWLDESGGDEKMAVELFENFKDQLRPQAKLIDFRRAIKIAASILILVSVCLIFYTRTTPKYVATVHQTPKSQIRPGSNKAVLTLANGAKIVLNNMGNGHLAVQNSTQIIKLNNGSIAYTTEKEPLNAKKVLYNTMSTPRGGKYEIVLADGTRVTLDAASSITYPVAFYGKERQVTVTGQAYFQVVHNASQPFSVVVKGQVIQDIGTAFNVNAYDDDPSVKITLQQGAVAVSNKLKTVSLKPGEQAEVKDGEQNISVKSVDVNEAIAWKNGWFILHNESIKDVMKQAARWYDVDIDYEGNIMPRKFGGTISKYKDISELLENLKIAGNIKYKIEGRRVILTN